MRCPWKCDKYTRFISAREGECNTMARSQASRIQRFPIMFPICITAFLPSRSTMAINQRRAHTLSLHHRSNNLHRLYCGIRYGKSDLPRWCTCGCRRQREGETYHPSRLRRSDRYRARQTAEWDECDVGAIQH